MLQEVPLVTNDINYPHNKRFIVMIDQRNTDINRDKTGLKMFIYEAPENYGNIPYRNASKWCLNATKDWLLPGIERSEYHESEPSIGAASSCDASLLTLSFHVFQKDVINCYLGWNGRIMHCDIEDLAVVLPKIFNTEGDFIGNKNQTFIKRNDEDGLQEYIKDMCEYIIPPKDKREKLKQFVKQHASIHMRLPPDPLHDTYSQWYAKLKKFETILYSKYKRKRKYNCTSTSSSKVMRKFVHDKQIGIIPDQSSFLCDSYWYRIIPQWRAQYHDYGLLSRLHPPYRPLNTLRLLSSGTLIQPLQCNLNNINVYPDINDKRHTTESIISCPHNQQPQNHNSSSNQNNRRNDSEKRNSGSRHGHGNRGSNKKSNGGDDDEDDEKKENPGNNHKFSNLQCLSKQQLLEIIHQQQWKIKHKDVTLQQQQDLIQQQNATIAAWQHCYQLLSSEMQKLRKSIANASYHTSATPSFANQQMENQNQLIQSKNQIIQQQQVAINALQQSNQALLPLSVYAMQDVNKCQKEKQELQQLLHKYQTIKARAQSKPKPTPPRAISISKLQSADSLSLSLSRSLSTKYQKMLQKSPPSPATSIPHFMPLNAYKSSSLILDFIFWIRSRDTKIFLRTR